MKHWIFSAFVCLNLSCAHGFWGATNDYDSQKIKIQLLSLFNQRVNPDHSSQTWRGDWLFRRERLSLVDRELSQSKPDLAMFQEMMRRDSNPFESDQGILSAGALKGFKWRSAKIIEYSDTGEEENLGFALSSPFEFSKEEKADALSFGSSGLVMAVAQIQGHKILLGSLKLDPEIRDSDFASFLEHIEKKLKAENICSHRLLLSVYAPSELQEKLEKIGERFSLVDAAKGFCNVEERCYTADPRNKIFDLTFGEILPARVDVLMVSNTAVVQSGERNFTEAQQTDLGYFKKFPLSLLWASDRFGWKTQLVLARCPL